MRSFFPYKPCYACEFHENCPRESVRGEDGDYKCEAFTLSKAGRFLEAIVATMKWGEEVRTMMGERLPGIVDRTLRDVFIVFGMEPRFAYDVESQELAIFFPILVHGRKAYIHVAPDGSTIITREEDVEEVEKEFLRQEKDSEPLFSL